MSTRESLVICELGRLDYDAAWDLQQELQDRLIEAKRQEPPVRVPHVLLLVEHPPVYTLGKSGDPDNLLLSARQLAERDATFVHTNRGGDITFHGPGQLVGYPLLDLDRFFTDIGRYLRTLESVIIRTCATYDLDATRVEGRTGTWIGPDEQGLERKICAMGLRCSRWVTMHGFAFNLNTDLTYFDYIVPCGIADRGVTSLKRELNRSVDEDEVRTRVIRHFADAFDVKTTFLQGDAAWSFVDDFASSEAKAPPT